MNYNFYESLNNEEKYQKQKNGKLLPTTAFGHKLLITWIYR